MYFLIIGQQHLTVPSVGWTHSCLDFFGRLQISKPTGWMRVIAKTGKCFPVFVRVFCVKNGKRSSAKYSSKSQDCGKPTSVSLFIHMVITSCDHTLQFYWSRDLKNAFKTHYWPIELQNMCRKLLIVRLSPATGPGLVVDGGCWRKKLTKMYTQKMYTQKMYTTATKIFT